MKIKMLWTVDETSLQFQEDKKCVQWKVDKVNSNVLYKNKQPKPSWFSISSSTKNQLSPYLSPVPSFLFPLGSPGELFWQLVLPIFPEFFYFSLFPFDVVLPVCVCLPPSCCCNNWQTWPVCSRESQLSGVHAVWINQTPRHRPSTQPGGSAEGAD